MPIGAIVARGDVMDWPPGSHASTFGGNPVSCRAALATIELLQSEYIANAAVRGEQLRSGLRELRLEFPLISDVRGLGLMTAMDLGKSATDPAPNPELREAIVQTAFRRGLLLLGCGESAIRFCPPLCISAAQVDTALSLLREILRTLAIG
jgi:4-aminobutyrate aminotransferase